MTDQPEPTDPNADLPTPLDGIDPEECMAVLLDPLADLAYSIKNSGEKLLTMLLRHEYARGFAAGRLAAAREAAPVEHVISTGDKVPVGYVPVGYVVKTRGDDSGRVMISPGDAGRAR